MISEVPPAPVNVSSFLILSAFVAPWRHAKSFALNKLCHPARAALRLQDGAGVPAFTGERDGHSALIQQILSAYCMLGIGLQLGIPRVYVSGRGARGEEQAWLVASGKL